MTIYSIYKITNLITDKHYIGYTSHIKKREVYHFKHSHKSKQHIHRAMRKYGIENFIFSIIYQSRDKQHTFQIMEPFFIAQYDSLNNGYNTIEGGKNIWEHTDASKNMISEANRKRIFTDETRAKIGAASRGRIKSPETCKRLSDSHKGKIISEEQKQKLRKAKAVPTTILNIKSGDIIHTTSLKRWCKDMKVCYGRFTTARKSGHPTTDGWIVTFS